MAKGTIKHVLEDKGFGFIQPDEGGDDIWFHASKVEGDVPFAELDAGLEVEYEAERSNRGLRAKFVRVRDPRSSHRAVQPSQPYTFLNPYNFVRFLPVPGSKQVEQPKMTAMAAAFGAKGIVNVQPEESPSSEERLLDRCTPPPHDRYVGITGEITCTFETITPLFVSDSEDVSSYGDHDSYEFFKLNNEPAVPGSSLRGMVRSVFEAITNSCLPSLSHARLSYHLPPHQALKLVPARVERNGTSGWQLRLLTGTTPLNVGKSPQGLQYAAWIARYLPPLRSSRSVSSPTAYGGRKNVSLNGRGHKSSCWALLRRMSHPQRRFEFWNVEQLADSPSQLPQPGTNELVREGYLCLNNQNIENKHDERFFFFDRGLSNAHTVSLKDNDKDIVKNYETLIRDYQERHRDRIKKLLKKGKNPEQPDGKKAAYSRFIVHEDAETLEDGELVYASLKSANEVEFIVPVSVPRLAYDFSIDRLLPDDDLPEANKSLSTCTNYRHLCPACRVFGWVHQNPDDEAHQVAYAGRISLSNGKLEHSAGHLPALPLAILSSPKPTTIRFYLMPHKGTLPRKWSDTDGAGKGYDKMNTLRGRKFYRHHGQAREEEYRRAGGKCDDQNRTVRDALAPGARFEFTLRFENLAPVELGALLWSLEMDGQGFQRLGYGKPLGFGSVEVRVKELKVLNPRMRYTTLESNGWLSDSNQKAKYVQVFKDALSRLHGDSFEALGNVQDLRALLGTPRSNLPIHYPRSGRRPDPEGKNFEWFMGNNRYLGYTLAPAVHDEGLPLITRDGTEIG